MAGKPDAGARQSTLLLTLGRQSVLLVTLVVTMLLSPLIDVSVLGIDLLYMTLWLSMLMACLAVARHKKIRTIALVLAALAFLDTLALRTDLVAIEGPGIVLNLVFFMFMGTVILIDAMRAEKVTTDKIAGALAAYILFGFGWAFVHHMLEFYVPGSYAFAASDAMSLAPGEVWTTELNAERLIDLMYFSFVTMTTLGYGDITPVSEAARSFSSLQALLGQMYLAVLVARLVGIHIAFELPGRRSEKA